jgi:hypothetical protein
VSAFLSPLGRPRHRLWPAWLARHAAHELDNSRACLRNPLGQLGLVSQPIHGVHCADLSSYDDNDAAAAPAPAAAPAHHEPVAAEPIIAPAPASAPFDEHAASVGDENGYGHDYNDNEEAYDDDDDEVDFNLGNSSNHAPAPKQEEVSTPAYHAARGPGAKEDG